MVDESKKDLVNKIREIEPNLVIRGELGRGGYGLVLKLTDGNKYYRLKILHTADVPGSSKTLEREYNILEDLYKKEGVTPKPVKLYTDVPCVRENRKGKHAYLTEFIKGKVLRDAEKMSSVDLTVKLNRLIGKIHDAKYVFGEDAIDLNSDNILSGEDGVLYLLDPMTLVSTGTLTEEGLKKALSKERGRINELIRRYSY